MAEVKWTARTVNNLAPSGDGETRYTFGAAAPGLILSVVANGTKYGKRMWRTRPMINGKRKMLTLGSFNDDIAHDYLSMEGARTAALEKRGELKQKADRQEINANATLNDLYKIWFERHAKPNLSRPNEEASNYRRLVQPEFGDQLAYGIRKGAIASYLHDLEEDEGASKAAKAHTLISSVYGYAIKQGQFESANPVAGLAKAKPEARNRVPTPDEVRLIWRAIDTHFAPSATVVQLCILMGRRVNELCHMAVADIDWQHQSDGDAWTSPAMASKSKLEDRIPLVGIAREIVADAYATAEANAWPYLFNGAEHGGDPNKPLGRHGPSDFMSRLCLKLSINDLRLHDFRRFAATSLADAGIDERSIELVLGHRIKQGVLSIYNRSAQLDAKRKALSKLDEIVADIVH